MMTKEIIVKDDTWFDEFRQFLVQNNYEFKVVPIDNERFKIVDIKYVSPIQEFIREFQKTMGVKYND